MKQPKKQTRLSMKLLWSFRDDYHSPLVNSSESEKHSWEYTRRFLNYVDQRMKSLGTTSNAKGAKRPKQ